MALEIGKDVSHHEAVLLRTLQAWKPGAIVHLVDQSCGRRKQGVEVSAARIVNSVQIGDTTIVIDDEIGDVARVAANLVKDNSPESCCRILFPETGLEVVQKIELQVVDNRGIELVLTCFRVGLRRRGILSIRPSSTMPAAVTTR